MTLKFALTCDDAPTLQAHPGYAPPDPARLDAVRVILKQHGVKHCMAFVIGSEARAGARVIGNWLDDGFRVGNHTFSHRPASTMTPEDYLADIELCHRELEAIGVFCKAAGRFFRFPFLDRGKTPQDRLRIREGLRSMSYTSVHATVDFYDHLYEIPMARAIAARDEPKLQKIEDRYSRVAAKSLEYRAAVMNRCTLRPIVHIAYFHLGLTSTRSLGKLLRRLRDMKAVSCDIEEAIAEPVHRDYEENVSLTGLISDWYLPQSILARGARKVASVIGQAASGPRWPYLG